MSVMENINRETWVAETFPEWGTWLNEEIEDAAVEKAGFSMWWLGCTGIWIKTENDTNICVDFWCGTGKKNHNKTSMEKNHQFTTMSGCKNIQPNLRISPFVLDPFAIFNLDALICTHYHKDHMDMNVAAAIVKNCPDIPFIGPQACIDIWRDWGIPGSRCVVLRPGDKIKIKDIEILALDSFDRTIMLTPYPGEESIAGSKYTIDNKALNYLIKTSGGNIYHAGDSHFSNSYAAHGNVYTVDVALGAYGQNPRGITDKMTSSDIIRMAENLKAKVIIPVHHDTWSNFMADTDEIIMLYEMQKCRMKYKFKPFIWQVGGRFNFPADKEQLFYNYNRGFEDVFKNKNNLPYDVFL